MSDLLHQNYNCVQSDKNPKPVTLASAATIAPLTRLTFITGTVAVATITPPVSGYHELVFIYTNAAPAALVTTGNIKTAVTPVQNLAFSLHYNPIDGKYWSEG